MSASGRKLAKRACDGCKIRKIKCSEVSPCDGCVAAGIACTFLKQPSTRGPRRLRKSTLREIAQSQQQWEDLGFGSEAPSEPVVHTKLDAESVFAPNKVAALVLQLCIYRLRMYPVWPIIKVERLVASLQKPEPDIEVFGLAYAVAAATIVQIRTKPSTQPGAVTADMMEAQCQYAKSRRNRSQPPDLTTVRIPFFLHVYYENLEPGGLQSITYLREAIAIAHMIGLHRESYYTNVQPEEREIRRRTLWLLFVAERNISISHKLPVTIRTNISFPGTIDSDSGHVLAAYQKLVAMFWDFDRSGVFELLDRHDFDFSVAVNRPLPSGALVVLNAMRQKLDENPVDMGSVDSMENTQALDLLVTRQWMRVILWRLTQTENRSRSPASIRITACGPLEIARELLSEIVHMPEDAIEAHSSVFESKVFEITISIVDSLGNKSCSDHYDSAGDGLTGLNEVLVRFHGFLSKNKSLLDELLKYIDQEQLLSQLQPSVSLALTSGLRGCSKLTAVQELGSDVSLMMSDASTSGVEVALGSQTGISPHSHWSAQPTCQDLMLSSPNTLASNPQDTSPIENVSDQSYLSVGWSRYEQCLDRRISDQSSGTWHDMSFVFHST